MKQLNGLSQTKQIFILLFSLLFLSCAHRKEIIFQPKGFIQQDTVTISKGKLEVTFVDNKAFGSVHKAGYNGIAKLIHTDEDSTVFVPFYAGFNLEHIYGGDSLTELFEPRKHPMSLFQKSATEVLLHQAATPLSAMESVTSFKVIAPHYIDITFSCLFHNTDFFKHNYAGIFWASYINHPTDKKIYFQGTQADSKDVRWQATFSNTHGIESTHMGLDDDHNFYFEDNFNASLANHFSSYRFANPFYFGRFHNMVLAYLFQSDQIIRFTQSPNGGGATNPAWDFQYLIPNPQIGKVYSFKARMIFKPFISREDILQEYQEWHN